ncbi:hydrogenase expression/formation protein HypE [Desulfosarcina widdelii]|uniref:Hydrogenase expression/formation protein HypE n=1 Tax=Desulfosarcina widdelii TaxID=947919 RepID=A0A5K7Z8Y2_9BACT|nr:hydrogenase expression/formation protein HypE [Desulfosarcina widdelii]BBO76161.1 hydrogenase expression/formation protein HypE [Desulfosarcina widdelii]
MKPDKILLDHGSGGKISHSLTADLLLPAFDNPALAMLDDGADLNLVGGRIAFSTDTYVVDPIFFPGGGIGDLAINGTVNDVAMCGARPLYLSVGMIIEEGFPMADLEKVIRQMGQAAKAADVTVVTGDTKVVPKGAADKIYINTAGIGVIPERIHVSGGNARPGDAVILSGTMADHGMTILTQREGLAFESGVQSDSAPLNHMVADILETGCDVHVLRDPTRGGVGTTLNEIALASRVGIRIHEDRLPIRPEVAGICDLLGFDPLYVANEGKLLAFVPVDQAETVLAVIKKSPYGREARIIGETVEDRPGRVFMKTRIGGERIVDMLTGEQLPRIC